MPLFVLVAATTIACLNPAHRDGQSIRCGEKAPVMQLEGISAPPIGAACTGGIACDEDPGAIARDHLANLTRGQGVVCTRTGQVKGKGRPPKTARCTIEGVDLSCTMVADGMATSTMPLQCPAPPPAARLSIAERSFAALPVLWVWIPAYLLIINLATFGVFALDLYRANRALRRVAPVHLLGLALLGGGIGGILAIWRLNHLQDEQPFTNQFAVVAGFQIGAMIGLFGLLLT
jgi:uncharacterized membrane protein YsdA (DUF1294 family)